MYLNNYQLFKPNKMFYRLVRVVVLFLTASEKNNCVHKFLVWSFHFLIRNAKLKNKLLNEYFSFIKVSKELYFSDFFEPQVGRQSYWCTIRHSSWSIVVAPWTEIVATLSERKLFRIRRRCAGHERMANESIIVGCHNESKALFISRKAGVHFFSSSNASSTNYTIE